MKLDLTGGGVLVLAGVAAVTLGGLYLYSQRGAIAKAAAAAGNAVNPASPDNLVNRGVSGIGAAVTGDASWSLGGQLAEWFSPSVQAANDSLAAVQPTRPLTPAELNALTGWAPPVNASWEALARTNPYFDPWAQP